MSVEANKALVQRFFDEVFNNGNTDAISDRCVEGSMFAGGIAGQVGAMKMAVPDNHFTIETIIAEDERSRSR